MMNFGLYHPSHNPYGCKRASDDKYWHNTTVAFNTVADCFNPTKLLADSGTIASGKSGRDDGRYGDAIYAGGLNGVIDWRLPAFEGDSPEEAAKVQAKVENKTYRGLEKLVRFAPSQYAPSSGNVAYVRSAGAGSTNNYIYSSEMAQLNGLGELNGSSMFVTDGTNYAWGTITSNDTSGRVFWTQLGNNGLATDVILTEADGVVVWAIKKLNLSVSGEFNTSMVIGDPANILQTDALKDGWLGTWCPVLPDPSLERFSLTRKSLHVGDYVAQVLHTTSNGLSWLDNTTNSNSSKVNPVTNEMYAVSAGYYTANMIRIISYTAYAKVTKPSTNKPVYNGKAGVMDVYATADYRVEKGCAFAESLLGNIPTSSNSSYGMQYGYYCVLSITLPELGEISAHTSYTPEHVRLRLPSPSNNSSGVKVLPYQISNNGQGSIGYQANELTYDADATNWGDDSAIKVTADGSDTFVDLNGNTNLSVVHELALPYGWTKNRARIGEQVEGIDL